MPKLVVRPTAFCSKCYDREEYRTEVQDEVASVREVTFSFPETKAYCKACGTLVYIPAVNDINVYERHKAYYNRLKEIRNGIC